MKGLAVFPGSKDVRLVDHVEPAISDPYHVKARMLEVGICGTDREIASFLYGEPPHDSDHLVLGHESLGEVVEVGSAVTTIAPGDLVVWMVRRPCGRLQCRPCRVGRQDFCITGEFIERGIKQAHGFLTEFVVDHEQYAIRVPRGLRDVAVLVEPLTIAEKGEEQARAVFSRLPGDLVKWEGFRRAVVLGAGPVGLLGAMKLIAADFETWIYSRGPATSINAEVAAAMGARFVSSDRHTPSDLAEMIGGIGLVYEATGAAKVSFDVLAELGANGVYVFTGVPGRRGEIELDADRIMRNMVLSNQAVVGTVNAGRNAFESAVADLQVFLDRFPEAVHAMITARVPMDGAREAVLSPPPGIKTVVAIG